MLSVVNNYQFLNRHDLVRTITSMELVIDARGERVFILVASFISFTFLQKYVYMYAFIFIYTRYEYRIDTSLRKNATRPKKHRSELLLHVLKNVTQSKKLIEVTKN